MIRLVALSAFLAVSNAAVAKNEDRTITKVVKLLQGMLEKSEKEGEEEKVIFDKFKCYCETSEAEKRASIKQQSELIEMLSSQIAEIQGRTGELSSDCAKLKVDMAANKQAREEAENIRKKENAAFLAEEQDLTQAIAQMKEAIEVLAEVGGDQTKSVGADHKQFMAAPDSANLLSLRTQVEVALKSASALMNPNQRKSAQSFVQAPFTGTYTSQSAEVVGILKEMRDTFTTNLETARETEKAQQAAFEKFMADKLAAFQEMESSYEAKQKALGENDELLSSKKEQLAEAERQLASDQEFLEKLVPMCEEKTKGYENRKVLRANEEAAIAEAISILNNDEAFEKFGTVEATSTGLTGFIQLRSVRKHMSKGMEVRRVVERVLEKAATDAKSTRVSKLLALVKADNPFETVLAEIDKMLGLIAEEGAEDKKNLDWCNSERKTNNANLETKKTEILGLEEQINTLKVTIDDPESGLKAQISNTELELVQNHESQVSETKERTEDNLAYQKDIVNLQDAQAILQKALKVLKVYYDNLAKKLADGEALMQEDPNPPEAWKGDGAYEGQSSNGGDVIKMLEFILSNTQKEETTAHSDEEKAQADYEDSMTALKDAQAKAEKSLAKLREDLAEAEQQLMQAEEDLKDTTQAKEAIEAYLAKIKPGCDFITTNFDLREKNRKTETEALEKAIKLIKETPAYKTYVGEATVESYGECKEPCVKDAEDVKCKACMADVTIPAYCAGHEGTKGC
jgi:hypothetical protein